MKSLRLCGLMFLLLIGGCGEPSVDELNQTMEKTGKAISNELWSKAEENLQTFSDYWNFHRSDYNNKQTKKVDKLIDEMEMSLAVSNKQKSRENWRQLHEQWKKMNK